MESLFILIPIALVFVAIAIRIFFWAVKSGQFDDLDTEAKRILFDDEPTLRPTQEVARRERCAQKGPQKAADSNLKLEPTADSSNPKATVEMGNTVADTPSAKFPQKS